MLVLSGKMYGGQARCGKATPLPQKRTLGQEIGEAAAKKSKGLFTCADWRCGSCAYVNWARRKQCNMCNAPKYVEEEERPGTEELLGKWHSEGSLIWQSTPNQSGMQFDVNNFKLIQDSYKSLSSIHDYTSNIKTKESSSEENTRFVPHCPEKILDAPKIVDDYYLNLLDWNVNNILAVALAGHVCLWNAETGEIEQFMKLNEAAEIVCSVSWKEEGTHLAIGTSLADVQIWDVEMLKRVRVMRGHTARIGSLSWNSYVLSSGSRTGYIHHHDVRIAQHHVGTLHGHTKDVCGLKWSPDGQHLASGGRDSLLNIWSSTVNHNYNENRPLHSFSHKSAVKAVAWCPWESKLLASGGGRLDGRIKIWDCNLGSCLNLVNTNSQICDLLWSKYYKELITGHGLPNNNLNIWKYPTMTKVAELTGHTARILNLAMSPDGSTVISAGADETLRLWKCFVIDNDRKKKETKTKAGSSASCIYPEIN